MLRPPPRREKLDFSFPTINVVLLLLFFFIITGTVAGRNETMIDPPVTADLPPERLPRPLLLFTPTGELQLDGIAVDTAAVIEEMQRRAAAEPNRATVLNVIADRSYPAAPFLETIDVLRAAGLPLRIISLSDRAKG